MGAMAKKGAVALMRRTMRQLKNATRKYEKARIEWRAIYMHLAEYKRYVRAKSAVNSKRDLFGTLWIKLPEDVRAELAREFWPELDNVKDAFDHNGLPVRTEQQNIRIEENRIQGPRLPRQATDSSPSFLSRKSCGRRDRTIDRSFSTGKTNSK